MITIETRPLTTEAFAPFGQALMAQNGVPERIAWAAAAENLRPEARANITYMSLEPDSFPVTITELERHPFSHQILIPLDGTQHLVVVCPSLDTGQPDLSGLIAFSANGAQSINYRPNVWHAPRTILHSPGAFIMMRWDAGTDKDTEFLKLETTITVPQ